jgi:hypothetical protein
MGVRGAGNILRLGRADRAVLSSVSALPASRDITDVMAAASTVYSSTHAPLQGRRVE